MTRSSSRFSGPDTPSEGPISVDVTTYPNKNSYLIDVAHLPQEPEFIGVVHSADVAGRQALIS